MTHSVGLGLPVQVTHPGAPSSADSIRGSMGPFVLASTQGLEPYVANMTAGHVVPDGETSMVTTLPNQEQVSLCVPPQFCRTNNRPACRQEQTQSWLDEVTILEVAGRDYHKFDCGIAGCNLYALHAQDATEDDKTNLLRHERTDVLMNTLSVVGTFTVYMRGNTSGITTGQLSRVRHRTSMELPNDEDHLAPDQLTSQWVGEVTWEGTPFAAPGDSGSLVWAVVNDEICPLGLLLGRVVAQPLAFFASVDGLARGAAKFGVRLEFISSELCGGDCRQVTGRLYDINRGLLESQRQLLYISTTNAGRSWTPAATGWLG